MACSKLNFDKEKLLKGTQELLAIAIRGAPVSYDFETGEVDFGDHFMAKKVSSDALFAIKFSLNRPLDHVVLSVEVGCIDKHDLFPAYVVALKDSENWLRAIKRIGPDSHALGSSLNYWNEKVIPKCLPEKVLMCAEKLRILQWAKNADVDKQWAVATDLFFFNTGLRFSSSTEDFLSCIGFLREEIVHKKMKSVFCKGITFYFEVDYSHSCFASVDFASAEFASHEDVTLESQKFELTQRLGPLLTEIRFIYGMAASVELLDKHVMNSLFHGKHMP